MKSLKNNKLAILNADWKQLSNRTITLLEIMKELDASHLITISKFIEEQADFLKSKPDGYILTKKDKKTFDHLFNVCIADTFWNLGWMQAHGSAMTAAGWIYATEKTGEKVSAQLVLREILDLESEIRMALLGRHLIIVNPEKVEFFRGGSRLFGEKVLLAFPSAKNEIQAAGDCLAVDLNTAAVFHLMRAAEFGMRALAVHLKVKLKGKPIEHGGWNEIIEQIEKKVELRRKRYDESRKKNKKELEFLKFCRIMADELYKFKEFDRNNTMHSIRSYNESEAKGVFDRVKEFMQRLSKEVSEK